MSASELQTKISELLRSNPDIAEAVSFVCLLRLRADFQQPFTSSGELWDRVECVKYWAQKVKVQTNGG